MRAEIIAFGDELVQGARINTNSAWISQQLLVLGIDPVFHTTAGDDISCAVAALQTACDRSDVVVCTGGLGPTADDVTRQAIAELVDKPLVPDPAQLQHIQRIFSTRGRTMPARNRVQAMKPDVSEFIDNAHGTAPGLYVCWHQSHIFALPGVPAEMREMWTAVSSRLRACGCGGRAVAQAVLKCFGAGESQLEEMIAEFTRRDRNPCVGITVHDATISLRVIARSASQDEAQRLAADTISQLQHRLGDLVFGCEEDELADVVLRRLQEREQTLALVEIAVPGILGNWMTEPSRGSSAALAGVLGFASWQTARRGLPLQDHIRQDISSAAAAAGTIRELFRADIGLSLVRMPDSDKVQIGIATDHGTTEHSHSLAGHPDVRFPRVAKVALNRLRLME